MFNYYEIKVPEAYRTAGVTFSEAFAISPDGRFIVGTFGERTGAAMVMATEYHGFFTPYGASPTQILFNVYNHPKSISPGGTSLRGINDRGDVVGFYRDENNKEIHGFVFPNYEPKPLEFENTLGVRSALPDIPFPTTFPTTTQDAANLHNGVLGINHQGSVTVGIYKDRLEDKDFGYIWGPAGPQIKDLPHGPVRVDVAEYPPLKGATRTVPRGIASANVFVGNYRLGNVGHGFRWKAEWDTQGLDGNPLPIDVSNAVETSVNGINKNLWIVGSYKSTTDPTHDHGFIWKPEPDSGYTSGQYIMGAHITFDFPNAVDTVINGISSDGYFVGYYRAPVSGTDSSIVRHAFAGQLVA